MGKLHDQLKEIGYDGHNLEVYLVRLLFCLFADDTGIFEKDCFQQYIEQRTSEDGSDLANHLAELFQVLNSPQDERLKTLDESLAQFPYVNGKLFDETLRIAAFNKDMRQSLLESCRMDWGKISPAIFGSLFQSVMDPTKRRNLGAHYTSEKNILKLIKPLFLDELREEFEKIKANPNKLKEFHKRLSTLRFFDPACGCGNFLVISYRELRLLEIDILRSLLKKGEALLDVHTQVWIDVDQFYGIEIEEFPARIAEVALWLIDHQMNMLISEEFGQYFVRLPLKKSPNIINRNALQIDWKELIPPEKLSYILGNPPFVGKKEQNADQKGDMYLIFDQVKGAGVLDYVCAWYIKAAKYIQTTPIRVAFVSTNSITQGEQVGIIWKELLDKYHVQIHFAHRTFPWESEASGKAHVHVVIVGFGVLPIDRKTIFEYPDPKGEPHATIAKNINPYLADAPNVLLGKRTEQVAGGPEINYGSMANDKRKKDKGIGNLILDAKARKALLAECPQIAPFIRPFMGSDEFINATERWCLWLVDAPSAVIRDCQPVKDRVEAVQKARSESNRPETRELAKTPSLFGEIRQPKGTYLLVPKVSSMGRNYMPVGFVQPKVIANGSALIIPKATPYHFGLLSSAMHMVWMRYTCGRMKSDYQYSSQIVYNNFPWPKEPSKKNIKDVEEKAQQVLDIRAKFPDSSLADLYDPLTMPPELVKAHNQLDKAVDLCYRPQAFTNDSNRIEYLFGLYNEYTSPLIPKKRKTPLRR